MNWNLEIWLSGNCLGTGILILIGSLGCLKEVKTMDMILGKSDRTFNTDWQFGM